MNVGRQGVRISLREEPLWVSRAASIELENLGNGFANTGKSKRDCKSCRRISGAITAIRKIKTLSGTTAKRCKNGSIRSNDVLPPCQANDAAP